RDELSGFLGGGQVQVIEVERRIVAWRPERSIHRRARHRRGERVDRLTGTVACQVPERIVKGAPWVLHAAGGGEDIGQRLPEEPFRLLAVCPTRAEAGRAVVNGDPGDRRADDDPMLAEA